MRTLLLLSFLSVFALADLDKKNFTVRKIDSVETSNLHSVELNVGIGPFFAMNPGVQVSAQFGVRVLPVPLFLGVEGTFTQYNPGNSFIGLGNLWYEFRVYGAPRFRLLLGVSGGYGFHQQQPLPPSTLVAFAEAGVSEEVDDGASIQGLLRPGYIGGSFAFLLEFKVSFRF